MANGPVGFRQILGISVVTSIVTALLSTAALYLSKDKIAAFIEKQFKPRVPAERRIVITGGSVCVGFVDDEEKGYPPDPQNDNVYEAKNAEIKEIYYYKLDDPNTRYYYVIDKSPQIEMLISLKKEGDGKIDYLTVLAYLRPHGQREGVSFKFFNKKVFEPYDCKHPNVKLSLRTKDYSIYDIKVSYLGDNTPIKCLKVLQNGDSGDVEDCKPNNLSPNLGVVMVSKDQF